MGDTVHLPDGRIGGPKRLLNPNATPEAATEGPRLIFKPVAGHEAVLVFKSGIADGVGLGVGAMAMDPAGHGRHQPRQSAHQG